MVDHLYCTSILSENYPGEMFLLCKYKYRQRRVKTLIMFSYFCKQSIVQLSNINPEPKSRTQHSEFSTHNSEFLFYFFQIIRCHLVHIVIQPVRKEQVGMTSPFHKRRLRRIIFREIVFRYMDFQSFVNIPEVFNL